MEFYPGLKVTWKRHRDGDRVIAVVLQVVGDRVQIKTKRADGETIRPWVYLYELKAEVK